MSFGFHFSESVKALGVDGIYFNIRGMTNRNSADPEVREYVHEILFKVNSDFRGTKEASGFDKLHSKVSAKPEKLVASSVALAQFWRARGDIPRINGIVDIYNAVSIYSMLAIGAHDLDNVKGDIFLRLTDGTERFWPLGSPKPAKQPKGEYAYVDEENDVLCRLEVRQVEKTKITMTSKNIFYIVQGHDEFDRAVIRSTARELQDISLRLFGGEVEPLYS